MAANIYSIKWQSTPVVTFSAVFMQFWPVISTISSYTTLWGVTCWSLTDRELPTHNRIKLDSTCWESTSTTASIIQTGGAHPSQLSFDNFDHSGCSFFKPAELCKHEISKYQNYTSEFEAVIFEITKVHSHSLLKYTYIHNLKDPYIF